MRSCTPSDGVLAGLLAGAAVMAVYFVSDLVQLDPFATPVGLSRVIVAPGAGFDVPIVAQILAIAGFGFRVISFTVLHFLVFAALGMGAAGLYRRLGMSGDVLSGALYGLVVCTGVFYLGMQLVGSDILSRPGLMGMLGANLLAGAVMGGYLQMARRTETAA